MIKSEHSITGQIAPYCTLLGTTDRFLQGMLAESSQSSTSARKIEVPSHKDSDESHICLPSTALPPSTHANTQHQLPSRPCTLSCLVPRTTTGLAPRQMLYCVLGLQVPALAFKTGESFDKNSDMSRTRLTCKELRLLQKFCMCCPHDRRGLASRHAMFSLVQQKIFLVASCQTLYCIRTCDKPQCLRPLVGSLQCP